MAVNPTHASQDQAARCQHQHQHHPHPHRATESSGGSQPLQVGPGQALSRFYIAHMDCPVEEQLIRSKLEPVAGVVALNFNLMQRLLEVLHESGLEAQIEADLQGLGMAPQRVSADSKAVTLARSESAWPIALAVLLALAAEGLSWWGAPWWWSLLVAGLALVG